MNEVEKMYELAKIAKPVIKKWYYDGYYEDFSWQSSEEDCTKLLKHFNNSVDELNNRIQQMKKEENTGYDRYTDSVDTEFGRIEKAYIDYPPFTAEKQLELLKWLGKNKNGFGLFDDGTEGLSCHCDFHWEWFRKDFYAEDFDNALAGLINNLWQDLTKEERKQIRNILESEVRE